MYDITVGEGIYKIHVCSMNSGICTGCLREFFVSCFSFDDYCENCVIEQLLWSGYFIDPKAWFINNPEEYWELLRGVKF